ncbi:MAG: PDZ domain-containing protein [Oscillospiraceae bacterium]|nr:PDZ domain-containing protein [Oscillospiraceae bacterium]
MNKLFKWLLGILALLIVVCLTFTITVGWMRTRYMTSMSDDAVKYKMQQVDRLLNTYFIDEYDASAVEQAAADGAAAAMITATGDRWSYYISQADMQAYEEQMTNSYVGIGVVIQEVDKGMEVMSVTAGSPAEEVGIQIGDICTAVEGQETSELGMDATQKLVRGEEGTTVNMRFLRGEQEFDVTVERRAIITDVATFEMLDDIALITIKNFDYHCAEQTISCMEDALEQGAQALLFDVRFNGGGLKDEMVEILDLLLPEGEVFRSVDYRGVEEVDTSDAAHLEIPVAVLVNEDSYSAAEFFAAALQEYGVAQVVGTQTVGKGNFQYTLELGDGSAVSLSVGKYYTPKGVSMTDVGVTPDILQDLSYDDNLSLYYGNLSHEDDEQLQAALQALK